MTCKGICIRHKALGRYTTGHKRCQVCELFVQWDGLFCPCCGYRLRTRPRSMKFKIKLRKQKVIQEAKKIIKILYCLHCLEEDCTCLKKEAAGQCQTRCFGKICTFSFSMLMRTCSKNT